MKHNIIFFSGSINQRAGGPSGYIANLEKGLNLINGTNVKIITKNDLSNNNLKHIERFIKLLTFWLPKKDYRKAVRSSIAKYFFKLTFDNTSLSNPYYKSFITELDKYDFDCITCHWVKDALFIYLLGII